MFKKKVEKLRGIATLWPNVFHIVTLEKSGIKSLNDLVGKRVAVGGPGSVTVFTAKFRDHGISHNIWKL
ncbi:MAG: TAXI family TRAP transporter solute-binding subunit, partial [bacterium]|nr:TAXI family TRAP transporter solute-binding subunit [bacterium]